MECPLTRQKSDMVVFDMINGRGQGWNWGAISFDLPPSIKDKIRAILCQCFGRAKNTILLKFSKDGEFSMKSACDIANPPQEQDLQFQGQWIWKLDMLPKIVNFLWLCLHNNVPVRDMLASRGINCEGRSPQNKLKRVLTLMHINSWLKLVMSMRS